MKRLLLITSLILASSSAAAYERTHRAAPTPVDLPNRQVGYVKCFRGDCFDIKTHEYVGQYDKDGTYPYGYQEDGEDDPAPLQTAAPDPYRQNPFAEVSAQ